MPLKQGSNIMKLPGYSIYFLGRIFIGLVFAYSGYTKLMEPIENFRGVMASYEIIPYAVIPILAPVIPWIEFVFGAFMILGFQSRASAFVLASMSFSFVVLILITRIVTGALPADCGCFGEGSIIHLTPMQVLFLDIFNTVMGIRLALYRNHLFSVDFILNKKD